MELRFRAWHGDGLFTYSESYKSLGVFFTSCEDEEKQQFTGHIDKNRKEIYEGDRWVVRSKKHNGLLADFIIKIDCYKLCFNGWRPTQGEVIGNIYENKDLLNTPKARLR